MKIFVTGCAGFIGMHTALKYLIQGQNVVGIDDINNYYDINLKLDRLSQLQKFSNFKFYKIDLANKEEVSALFLREKPEKVVHLAAQAGVRYSLENPYRYIDSNISGFLNILENSRNARVEHLVYASSSSVYGLNKKTPFQEIDAVDHPVSLYAATKKANELMAHTYSHLYQLPTTGLRFFTVYGPWGRPDMALFKFANLIFSGKPIDLYNSGEMIRDFTYIDDIVEGILGVVDKPPKELIDSHIKLDPSFSSAPYRIFNIGNSQPRLLMDYIQILEETIGIEAKKNYLPMQAGDVFSTASDTSALEQWVGFKPNTSILEGIRYFVDWYRSYYKL